MSVPTRVFLVLAFSLLGAWWVTSDSTREALGGSSTVGGFHSGAAFLTGAVLLDEGIPPGYVQVELLVRFGPGPDGALRQWTAPDESGAFVLDRLPAGAAKLSVGVGRLSEPLVVIEDLVVGDRGPVQDPRLAAIDLRERLNLYRFELLDPDGEPLREALVGYRPAGAERWSDEVGCVDGVATIVSEAAPIDLLVLAPGLAIEELAGVSQGGEVVLRDGLPVRLVLPADLDPARGTSTVLVRLAPLEVDPRVARGVSALREYLGEGEEWVFEGRELTLALSSPGTYEVQWRLLRQDGSESWESRRARPGERPRIVVRDTFEEQRFALALPVGGR